MKNTHIKNLYEEVPIEIRIKVYEEALNHILNIKRHRSDCFGLCLILPCILWDLNTAIDTAPDGFDWHYESTSYAFPELDNKVLKKLQNLRTESTKNLFRVKFLKESINKLKIIKYMKKQKSVFEFGDEFVCTQFFDVDNQTEGVDIKINGDKHLGSILGLLIPDIEDDLGNVKFDNEVINWVVDNNF